MKASKKLQKQFADFKAEFGHLCKAFGGKQNPERDLEFSIPTLWGKLQASIHEPWDFNGMIYSYQNRFASAAVYLRFTNAQGDCPFSLHGEFNQFSHKWNIHFSSEDKTAVVECCNAALTEFAKRLEKATGKTEAQAMRELDIANGELWQVYKNDGKDNKDTPILFEANTRSKALKWLAEKFGMAAYRNGAVRIGQLIWEEGGVTA